MSLGVPQIIFYFFLKIGGACNFLTKFEKSSQKLRNFFWKFPIIFDKFQKYFFRKNSSRSQLTQNPTILINVKYFETIPVNYLSLIFFFFLAGGCIKNHKIISDLYFFCMFHHFGSPFGSPKIRRCRQTFHRVEDHFIIVHPAFCAVYYCYWLELN